MGLWLNFPAGFRASKPSVDHKIFIVDPGLKVLLLAYMTYFSVVG